MKKLLICQFYTPNLEYAVMTEEINRSYCQKFDIDYFVEKDKQLIDEVRYDRSYCWFKIQMITKILKQKEYEYVMFVDADAIFVRNDFDIKELIDKYKESDLIISEDFGPDIVNTGVMIFKNTDWSIEFLEKIWEAGNRFSRGKYKTELWHEQTIMSACMLLNPFDREKVSILSPYDDNAINDHILRFGKTLIYHDLSKIRIAEIYKLGNGNYNIETELNLTCTSDRHLTHGYANFYYEIIEKTIKEKNKIRILDIGGDNGVLFDIFTKYYPQIEYYNITPSDYQTQNDKLNKIHIHDISLQTLSAYLKNDNTEYDIVIADYAHSCNFRDLIFSLFFDKVCSGGIFVVEDIQTDKEISDPDKNARYGWGDPNKKSMTQLISQFNVDGTFNSDYWDFKDLNTKIQKTELHQISGRSSELGLIYKK